MSVAKHIDDTDRPVIAGTDITVSHIAAQLRARWDVPG